MEIKQLSNIDLLALIRTVSLELENREYYRGMTKHVARKPMTFNQQRAELIQRAREFVEKEIKDYDGFYFTFVVNDEKRTVVGLVHGVYTEILRYRGIAKCMPGDVFNADIGKAIALAKALQIDIPREFMQAVQPDEIVVGHKIAARRQRGTYYEYDSVTNVTEDKVWGFDNGKKFNAFTYKNSKDRYGGETVSPYILDDTNAKYESVGD